MKARELEWRVIAGDLASALRRLWRVYARDNLDPSEVNPKPPPWIAEPMRRYEEETRYANRQCVGNGTGPDRVCGADLAARADAATD